jgi:2-polyprenyl-6-methoxyphenol hydroxylase-like FAD-dependent oxidoreductase
MQSLPIRSTEVLVVGAGPVGLFGALCAARRGLDVVILEQSFQGFGPGYASLLHPRSVRLLREEGIGDEALSDGRPIEKVGVYVDKKLVSELHLASPALAIRQTTLEQALLTALRGYGVKPFTPYQAAIIEQGPDAANVRIMRRELVRRGSPANYSEWEPVESSVVQADFVIGADGYDSRVRSALGIDTVKVGKTETFAIFEAPTDANGAGIELFLEQGLGGAMLPLANARARWSFQIDSGLDASPDTGRLRALLSERAPREDVLVTDVEWGTVMHFERRLTRSFGKGRVWLAGDAAHVTSPFGAQSVNGGFFEAHDLVSRIADIARRRGPSDTLEQYGHERLREWHKLLGVNVDFDLMPNAEPWLADHARKIVPALPLSGPELDVSLKALGLRVH